MLSASTLQLTDVQDVHLNCAHIQCCVLKLHLIYYNYIHPSNIFFMSTMTSHDHHDMSYYRLTCTVGKWGWMWL